jgi:dienelactone hydrolase
MTYDGSEKAFRPLSASPATAPCFEISPNPTFVDEDERVCLRGLPTAALISIHAATEDDQGRRWSSEARYRADSGGSVDASAQESLGGSYRGAAPMGLFWSMESAAAIADGSSSFAKSTTSPDCVELEAQLDGRVIARASLTRNFLAPGTVTRDLKIPNGADGGSARTGADTGAAETTVGRLFIPPGRRPHPAAIVLSGSGGGFDLDKAAVLSRHGYATLALAYFGIAPLPTWLHRIPLEYFEAALAWLHAQPEIDSQRLGILGVSRGAELALLLGSRFPQVHAIVAYAPSSVAWAAGGRDNTSDERGGEIIPCWTWRGKPVPFAPLPLRGFMWRSAFPVVALKRPVMFRNLFRAGLRNRQSVERAAIPVESIRGPILLISGGDDHLWPAAEMSEAIIARLKSKGSAHAPEHLHFAHAGHMLRYPHLPVTARTSRNKHLRGARFSFGGTPAADAEAQTQAWRRTIAFLRANL